MHTEVENGLTLATGPQVIPHQSSLKCFSTGRLCFSIYKTHNLCLLKRFGHWNVIYVFNLSAPVNNIPLSKQFLSKALTSKIQCPRPVLATCMLITADP
jgi:hypothetical protein